MSVILESANRINALKSAVEAVTGQSYDNLTQGIQALKDGYSTSEVEGIQYTDIIYNDDDTVTLIDTNGNEHIIACTYENNRLMSMTYDGKEVMTVYDHGDLVAVGETEVNVVNAPLDSTLENLIDQSGVLDSTDGTATEKVEQLIDKAEDENIWYLYTTNMIGIPNGFKKTPTEKLPRMDFSKVTSLANVFSLMPIKRVDYYINSENCTNCSNVFLNCTALEYVKGINTSKATTVEGIFRGCLKLKTIEEPLDFSLRNDVWQVFFGCNALENVRFFSECIHTSITIPSPVLSDESIQSIIDGLNSEVTGQTLTIPRNAVKKAFETSEGANDGDTSETWNALVASKPNWTITLS